MRQTFSRVALCALGIALLAASTPAPQPGAYVVIVNAVNPTTAMTDADIAKLFLKRTLRWPGGRPVIPVDQQSSSATRVRFSIEVLRKKPSAVDNYWQQQIFSAREIPPIEKGSDLAVLSFIEANPDAIGYVAATAVLGRGVRILKIARP
jgi:ABC-type phosphate transport system substrate-binding protein